VDARDEYQWSHAWQRFKQSNGVKLNGILECKSLSTNVHRTNGLASAPGVLLPTNTVVCMGIGSTSSLATAAPAVFPAAAAAPAVLAAAAAPAVLAAAAAATPAATPAERLAADRLCEQLNHGCCKAFAALNRPAGDGTSSARINACASADTLAHIEPLKVKMPRAIASRSLCPSVQHDVIRVQG
jgi:hypothetical protein